MRKFLVTLLVILVLAQVWVVGASAASDYTYTVRVFAGNHGSIDGSAMVVVTESAEYGSMVTFDPDARVTLENDKYYIQGIRLSGRDNYGAIQPRSFPVTEDADYVVAYGIAGDLVTYTVNYVDEAGNALAESSVYHGNVGEKVVVAFLYIDGYEPQAYNITFTIKDDPMQEYDFVYTAIEVAAPVVPTPAVPAVPETAGGGAAGGGAAGGGAAGGAAAGGDAGAAGEGADADNEAAADETAGENADNAAANEANAPEVNAPVVNIPEEEVPAAQGPQEIIDLDEDDTPLGTIDLPGDSGTGTGSSGGSALRLGVSIGVLAAALSGLGAFAVFMINKRKEQREEALRNIKFNYTPFN